MMSYNLYISKSIILQGYYCIGLNKNEKSENIIYYIHPFYVNTNFYQGDANGNYKIPEYKPRKR